MFSIIIKSSRVLLLTETKAFKSSLLPWWSYFCNFHSLNEMGSGTVCLSEPPSLLIEAAVNRSNVFFPPETRSHKKIPVGSCCQSADVASVQSPHTKETCLKSGPWQQLPVFPSCRPLFTVTTKLHIMNNSGPCVGAAAGPVLIWDKDRLLISGPEALARCLGLCYATNPMDRMLRLLEVRRREQGRCGGAGQVCWSAEAKS